MAAISPTFATISPSLIFRGSPRGADLKCSEALGKKGTVRALRVPGGGAQPSEIDAWTELAKELKAKGLAYILFREDGPQSPLLKFFKEGFLETLQKATGAELGDALFFGADKFKIACASLGRIRSEAAKRFNLVDTSVHSLFWVTNFPDVRGAGRWIPLPSATILHKSRLRGVEE